MKQILEGEETQRVNFRRLNNQYFNEWVNLFKEENGAAFLGLPVDLSSKELCIKWFDKAYHR